MDTSKNSCGPSLTTKHSDAPSNVSKINIKKAENEVCTSIDGSEKQRLSCNLNQMSLNVKSESAKDVNGERVTSQLQYKPEEWMLPDKSEDTLSQLNLAIVSLPSFLISHDSHYWLFFSSANCQGYLLHICSGGPC